MAENAKTELADTGSRKQLAEQDKELIEEVKMLRQHVADMYRAWMVGKAPIPPPPGFSNDVLTRTLVSPDHSSISQIEEKPKEDFGKFWLKWSEQVAMGDLPVKRKDVLMPHQCQSPVVAFAKRPQSQHRPRGYPRGPCNPPQRYFSPRDSQRHASLAKHPTPQNAYPPPRAYRKTPGLGFRPNEAFRKERLLKREKALNPIGESYASLFERLKHAGLIEPLPGYTPDPRARSFDPIVRCAYHSNVQGHNTEDCRSLKKEIERMIQEGVIVINDNDREHGNPLKDVLTKAENVEADSGLGNIDAKLSG